LNRSSTALQALSIFMSITAWVLMTTAAMAQNAPGLRAAAGKIDITPTRTAFLAGYGSNRRSVDAHDRLMARCLMLESGGTRIAFVSCDVIGLPRYQIERIRAAVHAVTPEHLIINATHTHSGPDTMGQWGPDIKTSGVDPEWMATVRANIASMVDGLAGKLRPAALKFAASNEVPRVSKNIRVPRILDTGLAIMQAVDAADGKTIATVVNYACHPEILNTYRITADFPHWLYETVESAAGGTCLYWNGAQGGMITADYDESTAPRGENWQAAETIGTQLGKRVLELLQTAEPLKEAHIATQRRVFTVPLQNGRFKALIALHVFPQGLLKNGEIETEVNRITIGPAEILTLPGEALPNIGFYLKQHMQGDPKFLIGLCSDELGYILTPEDYYLELYKYENSQSVGEQMGALMVQNLLAMEPSATGAKVTTRQP
jgi:hypothetical protein